MTTKSTTLRSPRRAIASSRLPLIVAVVALLIAAAAYFYSGGFGMQKTHAKETAASEKKHAPTEVYEIGDFLLNVKTDGQLRYLKVEIAANITGYEQPEGEQGGHGHGESEDEGLATLNKQQEALARDAVVQILSDTDFEVLKTSEGRRQTKEKIKEELDEVIEGADVQDILFVSFVMQ